MDHPYLMFLDHTQRRSTVGRTPLDEWSARRKDLYLTTHNTHNIQTAVPPGGIRTQNPSKRAAADPHLRPRGHWCRHMYVYIDIYIHLKSNVHLIFGNIILFWYTNVPCSPSILCTGIPDSYDSHVYEIDSNLHILFTFFFFLLWFHSLQFSLKNTQINKV